MARLSRSRRPGARWIALAVAGALFAGCVLEGLPRDAAPRREVDVAPAAAPIRGEPDEEVPTVPSSPALASPRALPAFDHEPLLSVLVARAPRVVVELGAPAQLEVGGRSTLVGPGTLVCEGRAGTWRVTSADRVLAESSAGAPGMLASGGRPIFALDATPLFGAPRRLQLAGDLVLQPAEDGLEVIERVRMEDYVASVVAAEMNSKWPQSALAAQAIVARSYAAARWMERESEPWQLHWHFGVDMAYHGWSANADTVARAIESTRGEVLLFAGFPVLALFHASSGGRTEAFERIKPGVFAPDGKTPIAAAMPVVEDAAAELGAAGLALSASHGRWKTDIPLPELTQALEEWSRAVPGRPAFGDIEAVSVLERHADSGRVAKVSVRHRLDGAERFTALAATDFRQAVGPVRVRSLWWERCVIAAKPPGYLVLEGRGFGHGCGLSQVSAWYLATQGESPEAIVARFYAGARIERRY
jgi:peptidoglycan hydrolase-like amidase